MRGDQTRHREVQSPGRDTRSKRPRDFIAEREPRTKEDYQHELDQLDERGEEMAGSVAKARRSKDAAAGFMQYMENCYISQSKQDPTRQRNRPSRLENNFLIKGARAFAKADHLLDEEKEIKAMHDYHARERREELLELQRQAPPAEKKQKTSKKDR